MFTILTQTNLHRQQKPNKMKKIKLIKWVDAGRYMSNNNKYQYIPNWICFSLLGETYISISISISIYLSYLSIYLSIYLYNTHTATLMITYR